MQNSYIFREDVFKKYIDDFNRYAIDILYGSQILIGSDIENEWKDVPVDDEE